MTKQLLMVLASLLVTLEANSAILRTALSPNEELANKRVLKVHGMTPGSDWYGTGFLVNTPVGIRILTNKHVCGVASQLTVKLSAEPLERTVTIERRAGNRADLCLLRPDATLDTSAGGYDVASVVGPLPANVTIYGYPHAGGLAYSASTIRSIYRLVDASPMFNGVMSEDLSEPVIPGSSGSPVLDSHNQIVGVVYGMDSRNAEHVTGLGVPLLEIRQFLNGGAQ